VIAQGNDKSDDDALTNQLVLKYRANEKARKEKPKETDISGQAQRDKPYRGAEKRQQK
jgi:hypothetical protein